MGNPGAGKPEVPENAVPPKKDLGISQTVREQIKLPGSRYKVSLAKLVSKVVAANPEEYADLKAAVEPDFTVRGHIDDALRVDDWEKALNDEASFQFSSKHRPLAESVLNGIDSELRREAKTGVKDTNKRVDVAIMDKGFVVKDHGEGMDLDTVLVKLLIPKLTGNQIDTTDVIGRFGVGFYSLLGYLHGKNDHVVVRTYDGNEGYRVSLSRYFSDSDQTQNGRLSVVISPLNNIEKEKLGHGTEVKVRSENFDKQGGQKYVSETLRYKPDAVITVNDTVINDTTATKSIEANLDGRSDEKTRKIRIVESDKKANSATVVLAVGGVKVEQIAVSGEKLPETVVLDFPPGTALPKSRDKVEVNEETIAAVSTVIETIFRQDVEHAATLVTALGPVVARLQARNPKVHRDKNMELQFREQVGAWAKQLPSGRFLIPNSPEIAKLDIAGAIPIDAAYMPSEFTIPGYPPEPGFSSHANLYWVPFKNTSEVMAITNGAVFVNEQFRTTDPRVLGMFNALFAIHAKTVSRDNAQIAGKFTASGSVEREKESVDVAEQPPSEEAVKETPKEMKTFISSFYAKLVGRPILATRDVEEYGQVPIPEDEFNQMVQERTVHITREEARLTSGLLDAVNPKRAREREERRQRIIASLPRTRRGTITRKEEYEAERDYSPSDVSQIREWWLGNEAARALNNYSSGKVSYRDYFISDDPAFWQRVINDAFYSSIGDFITSDRKVAVDALFNALPNEARSKLLDAIGGRRGLDYLKNENIEYSRFTLLTRMKELFASSQFEGEDRILFARAAVSFSISDDMVGVANIYNDTAFLQTLCQGGEFASFFNQIVRGDFSRYGPGTVDFSNFAASGRDLGFVQNELSALQRQMTTEQRVEYMRWYLRNREHLEAFRKESERVMHITKDGRVREEGEEVEYEREGEDGKTYPVASYGHPEDIDIHFSLQYYPHETLYVAGLDSQESWENLSHNISLMREIAVDTKLREQFFLRVAGREVAYAAPELPFFAAGRIDRTNIAAVSSQVAANNFLSDRHQSEYAVKALGYAHLPSDAFNAINGLLARMAREKLPASMEELFSSSLSGFYSSHRDLMLDDGWLREGNKIEDGSPNYRLFCDTPAIVLQRAAFLENLPAEYARVYFRLQKMLVDPQPGIQARNYADLQSDVEAKLQTLFTKLAQRPSHEAIRILTTLAEESMRSKTDLQQKIAEFGEVKRIARPWLLYLFDHTQRLPHKPAAIFMKDMQRQAYCRGSELVGRYFTSEQLVGIQSVEQFQQVMNERSERERAREVGQRRIEHAANYQSTEGYVWLRELVQNAYNATRVPGAQKAVRVENYIEGADFVIEVTDPVGMTLDRVVNSLLVPQKSEWDASEVIGYFGHGFFTVFKEADEVRVKTSTGDGNTLYVAIDPVRNYKTGKVMDLTINVGTKAEQFKGTSVAWVKRTDFQEFEASKAKAELTTYAGLVPSEELSVLWNGEEVNKNPRRLATAASSLGDVRMHHIAGENTVTQNGLYMNELDFQYTAQIPGIIRQILLQQGIVIDIPSSIHLIDSRTDIANKEDVLPLLYPAISQAAVSSAAAMFIDGTIALDQLPYDFFTRIERYAGLVPQQVTEDVERLMRGEQLTDWSAYINDEAMALQLIMSIPAISFDEQKISVYEAIQLAKRDPSAREKLPAALEAALQAATVERQYSVSLDETRFEQEGYKRLSDFSEEKLPSDADTYKAWQHMHQMLLEPVVAQTEREFVGTFYSQPDGSIAHYTPNVQTIGWNLFHLENIGMLARLLKGESLSDAERMVLYQDMVETGSHEYEHRMENTGEMLTHDRGFFQGQKSILEGIIRNARPAEIEEVLKRTYKGGFITPRDLTVQLAQ